MVHIQIKPRLLRPVNLDESDNNILRDVDWKINILQHSLIAVALRITKLL